MAAESPVVEIRPLATRDFDDWLPLWHGYLQFYRTRVPIKTTQASFARLTGGRDGMGGFIARDGAGGAKGLAHWILHPSTWTQGDYCYLQDLFVIPGHRGTGVGRRLIEAVYDEARTRGAARVYWLTHETNAEAIRLYDKVADPSGFIQYRKLFR
jgi:GNAT superfamily N-acetyltransferase